MKTGFFSVLASLGFSMGVFNGVLPANAGDLSQILNPEITSVATEKGLARRLGTAEQKGKNIALILFFQDHITSQNALREFKSFSESKSGLSKAVLLKAPIFRRGVFGGSRFSEIAEKFQERSSPSVALLKKNKQGLWVRILVSPITATPESKKVQEGYCVEKYSDFEFLLKVAEETDVDQPEEVAVPVEEPIVDPDGKSQVRPELVPEGTPERDEE